MANLQAELERIAAERRVAERETERIYLRELLRACVECVVASAAGIAFMFFAFYVSDEEVGRILLWSGLIVGYSGVSYALLSAYRRGEQRGDW